MNALTESDQQKLRDTYLKVRGMKGGPGVRVHHERDSVVISLLPKRERAAATKVGKDVTVRITAAASGGGKYDGLILFPPTADVDSAGNLSAADVGDATDAAECLIVNMNERGASTHWLTDAANTAQKDFNGRILRVNSDGVIVVGINGAWFKTC